MSRIYEEPSAVLTSRAKELYAKDKMLGDLEFDKSIYALDFSAINICLSFASWARYKESKGSGEIKLHSLIDLKGNIPSFYFVTDGKVYDGAIIDQSLHNFASLKHKHLRTNPNKSTLHKL